MRLSKSGSLGLFLIAACVWLISLFLPWPIIALMAAGILFFVWCAWVGQIDDTERCC